MREYPSQDQLRSMFCYCQDTGNLIRIRPSSNQKAGEIAGYVGTGGYRLIRVNNIIYGAHRLIWIYVNGDISIDKEIDHIDGNPINNRIENLRQASRLDNMRNRKMHKNNSSGYKGVCFDPKRSKSNPWRARIVVHKKSINLGMYSSPEKAHEAYKEAALKYFGDYASF